MIHKIEYLRDILGNNYIGIKYQENELKLFLNELYDIIDDDIIYHKMIGNQAKRDIRNDHTHHTVIISAMEYNKMAKIMGAEFQKRLEIIFALDITDISYEGIGVVERAGSVAYFVILDSPTIDEVRYSLRLDKKDLHITLGFDPSDVYGVPKNIVLKKKKLKELIDSLYSRHDGSHLWLHDISNFDDNLKIVPEDKIEILNMTDTYITYKIGHTQIQISLIDSELRVATMCDYVYK